MELYLLIALIFIYLITAAMVNKQVVRKIWTLAFIASFVITALAIGFLRINNADVMLAADSLNWYYLLYLFGSISVVLGIINLWMYRISLWYILFSDNDDENNKE